MGNLLDWVERHILDAKKDTFTAENSKYFGTKYEYVPKPKEFAAGGVVLGGLHGSLIDHFYLVKPAGKFGGREWVIPKGRIDLGESREIAALREVLEESGLVARMLPNGYLGRFDGSFTMNDYYMMARVGGNPLHHDKETAEVRLVSFEEAKKLLAKDHNDRDLKVVELAEAFVAGMKSRMMGEGR